MKQIKLLFSMLFLSTIYSCGTLYNVNNEVKLQNVETTTGNKSNIIHLDNEGQSKYSFEDELIKITWQNNRKDFSFLLQNKTENSIKILWDDSSYLKEDGTTSRIIHSGVKYIDKNNSQPPTVVIKNGILEDIIIPTDNISYSSISSTGWGISDIFKTYLTEKEKEKFILDNKDSKVIKILLPIEIKGEKNEYLFSFNVTKSIINK